MNPKSLLRLLILTQTFLLFALICIPLLIHFLHQMSGKLAYGCLALICVGLALLLRRELTQLE
jgi:hypothetical protein